MIFPFSIRTWFLRLIPSASKAATVCVKTPEGGVCAGAGWASAWGEEAQVDWYEAYADIGGEREKAYVFCMRSMASGGAFHCAFPHCSQQAFLEAHELGFAYFLGVFKTLRYDNLKSVI
jgi:hypothetical protein